MKTNRLVLSLVLTLVSGCLLLAQPAYAQAPMTLTGTFVLRQSDIEGECNANRFSDAPETGGDFTLTIDAQAGNASGSLQGGGEGTRDIRCPEQNPVPSAQMNWRQSYTATFSGSFDATGGAISMSGTLDGSNDIRWRGCKAGDQTVDCQADFSLNDYAQPYSFPVTFTGTYDAATNSASGTWTVSPIVRPTSGEWRTQGAATTPGSQAASAGDPFNRPNTDDPCALGSASIGGRELFYLPIFPDANSGPIGARIADGALENNGLDFGGFQFALSDACAQPRGFVRGADMGQDLYLHADLLVPANGELVTQAGPYFRSRAAAYADGIIGGESAGYWVQLSSTGEIKIKQLNPFAEIAASCRPAVFDPTVMHTIEIAASGDQLQVGLDGARQTFQQNNQVSSTVNIPPTGGANDGTAGIAFGAETNRGQLGGQRADNVSIAAYHSLDVPVQDNCSAAGVRPTVPVPTATRPSPTNTAAAIPSIQAATRTTPPPITPISPLATLAVATAAPATAVASGSPTTVAQAVPGKPGTGDCNSDGKLTEVDALCALQISVQLAQVNLALDMDGNGFVDSRDAVIILQRAVAR